MSQASIPPKTLVQSLLKTGALCPVGILSGGILSRGYYDLHSILSFRLPAIAFLYLIVPLSPPVNPATLSRSVWIMISCARYSHHLVCYK